MSVVELRSLMLSHGMLHPEELPPNHEGHWGGVQPGDVGFYSSKTFVRVANILPDLIHEGIVKGGPVMSRLDDETLGYADDTDIYPCIDNKWSVLPISDCASKADKRSASWVFGTTLLLCNKKLQLVLEYALSLEYSAGTRQKYFLDSIPSIIWQHRPSRVSVPQNLILGKSMKLLCFLTTTDVMVQSNISHRETNSIYLSLVPSPAFPSCLFPWVWYSWVFRVGMLVPLQSRFKSCGTIWHGSVWI